MVCYGGWDLQALTRNKLAFPFSRSGQALIHPYYHNPIFGELLVHVARITSCELLLVANTKPA